MKWSYTSGKINISSDEEEQQFLLEELIEELAVRKAIKKKVALLFTIISITLLVMQDYGADLPKDMSVYFYIGYFLTPIIISGFFSLLVYIAMRKSPKKAKRLNKFFKD